MEPYVAGWYYVPNEMLFEGVQATKRLLTVASKPMPDKEQVRVRVYDDTQPGYLGVPIDWGKQVYGSAIDMSTDGAVFAPPQRPDPNHPLAAPGQAQFFSDLISMAQTRGTFLAVAPTGSGKTVSALNMAAELGRSTLVLVHLENLLKQWKAEAIEKLGLAPSDIGIVKQGKCEYAKGLVLAMSPSVARREYPDSFYNAFGTVIWDEVHRVGAPVLSKTLGRFTARYKVALTATPKRKDGLDFVFHSYFGTGAVHATAPALRAKVTVLPYANPEPVWGKSHGARMMCLERDWRRNNVLTENILSMYRAGRKVLVIGDRVKHLQALRQKCIKSGVPMGTTGMFVGEIYSRDGKKWLKEKVRQEYLDWVRDVPALVFATYGMMKEGTDFPRLDAGIDATPRGDATQVIGRIRRPVPGKPMPEWVTLHDLDASLQGYYFGRLRDYESANVELNYRGGR